MKDGFQKPGFARAFFVGYLVIGGVLWCLLYDMWLGGIEGKYMDKANRLAGFVLILMVLVCGVVFGDGKIYPEWSVKVPPDIPSQRAVLSYRDGLRRLS